LFVLHGGSSQLGPGITPEWVAANHAGMSQAWWKCSNVAHSFDVWFLNLFPQNAPSWRMKGAIRRSIFSRRWLP